MLMLIFSIFFKVLTSVILLYDASTSPVVVTQFSVDLQHLFRTYYNNIYFYVNSILYTCNSSSAIDKLIFLVLHIYYLGENN